MKHKFQIFSKLTLLFEKKKFQIGIAIVGSYDLCSWFSCILHQVPSGFSYNTLIFRSVIHSSLFQVADYNVVAAQQGIIYIDEVDKITKKVLVIVVK